MDKKASSSNFWRTKFKECKQVPVLMSRAAKVKGSIFMGTITQWNPQNCISLFACFLQLVVTVPPAQLETLLKFRLTAGTKVNSKSKKTKTLFTV
jgi:hypothetical protein